MELGDLINTNGPVSDKLFTYVRYNTDLTRQGLESLGISDIDPAVLWAMDNTRNLDELNRVGTTAADCRVSIEHFAGFY